MRSKTIFGALLVSVALCSQGFGFELLDRMLGLNCGGCGECNACAKVACCEKACPKACEPACEKACPKACEPTCDNACGGTCKKCRRTPVRDLFAGMKDLFECKGNICETGACEAAKGCCPEPAACEKACPKACEPACEPACGKVKKCRKVRCEKACETCGPAACEPACAKACEPKCHKLYRRPVVELLENLFGCEKGCKNGCEAGCATACGDCGACGGGAPATKAAPAKAPEQAAPLPAAPKADPSASIQSRGIYQAARSLARN
jgi:hypothetical protein